MKDQQRAEEGLDRRVGESQTAGPLPIDLDRIVDPVKRALAQGTILADPFDVQETPVGSKADPPQGGEVRQPFAEAEVAGVVDRRLGPQGAAFLMILLDPGTLVIDVQRRDDPPR